LAKLERKEPETAPQMGQSKPALLRVVPRAIKHGLLIAGAATLALSTVDSAKSQNVIQYLYPDGRIATVCYLANGRAVNPIEAGNGYHGPWFYYWAGSGQEPSYCSSQASFNFKTKVFGGTYEDQSFGDSDTQAGQAMSNPAPSSGGTDQGDSSGGGIVFVGLIAAAVIFRKEIFEFTDKLIDFKPTYPGGGETIYDYTPPPQPRRTSDIPSYPPRRREAATSSNDRPWGKSDGTQPGDSPVRQREAAATEAASQKIRDYFNPATNPTKFYEPPML
jgi:hypothetical protein